MKPNKVYSKYLNTYSGKKLIEKHLLTETGVWKVVGEDPNCDWGGPHHQPFLAYIEGSLEKVILVAIELDNFWTWGGGGTITKENPREVIQAKDVIRRVSAKESALAKLTTEDKKALGLI
tara:strand:- start:160 stop:519 length:360 start_codon:yes stop_codon:yes gene_type:complete